MSFNRLKYDICEQKKYVKESIGPGNYYLNQPLICGTCFQDNPSIIMQKTGVSLNKSSPWRFYDGPVDTESELKNLSRPASRCPSKKYLPKCSNCNNRYQGQPCSQGVTRLCAECSNKGKRCGDNDLVDFPTCHFPVNYTRLNDCLPRCVSVNRFEHPCLNPQINLEIPCRENTRLNVKDSFVMCQRKPAINNMNPCPQFSA